MSHDGPVDFPGWLLRGAVISAVMSVVAISCGTASERQPDEVVEVPPTSVSADVDTSEESLSDVEESADVDPEAETLFGPVPALRDGPLDPEVVADLDAVFSDLTTGFSFAAVRRLGQSGDPRVAWLISDLLRFIQRGESEVVLREAFTNLTGATIVGDFAWQPVTDRLIAWDVPAPPGYVDWKRKPFEIIEPSWQPFFDDAGATIDWRHLSWGGVLIDDRPISTTHTRCIDGCIAAMTEPPVTDAEGGGWYADDKIVFGVVVNGEARAYPKNQMEVHEMVNDVLGGRRIAVPYCTLCGSAQAYLTDGLADVEGLDLGVTAGRYEMRTSGLLTRSNKVMFELQTFSVFDTFTGMAVSGPLRELGVRLPQITVETATWGAWRAEHPDTTIVAETGVLGVLYPENPLRGRDDAGPIFPIGDVDDRLDAQATVIGVVLDDGTAVAFDVSAAEAALDAGQQVMLNGVQLVRSGGLRAQLMDGMEIVSHQAFWFAWSQFHETMLWTGG